MRAIHQLWLASLLSAVALAQSTPPVTPLLPYLPPAPAQGFVWVGRVTLNLNYQGLFSNDNFTEKNTRGFITREKRGSEDMQAVINLIDRELMDCNWKCNPNVGNVQYTLTYLERFISEQDVLCDGKRAGKQLHIFTQERFTLGPDGQQGQLKWNLRAKDLTPRVEWNAATQMWTLWLTTLPLTTPLRIYDKTEDVDCAGAHPSPAQQQLLNAPLPLPLLVPLKKQTMTFGNTLSGSVRLPMTGMDGLPHDLQVNYELRIVPSK